MSGKRPQTNTPKDMRLKANKTATPKTTNAAPPLKFGSPAWRAKYGK